MYTVHSELEKNGLFFNFQVTIYFHLLQLKLVIWALFVGSKSRKLFGQSQYNFQS